VQCTCAEAWLFAAFSSEWSPGLHLDWLLLVLMGSVPAQEADTIRLKREAKAKNGFYVEPEGKVVFAVRIRGINDMHPKTRKILQLLRLRQIHNGVFVRVRGPGGPGALQQSHSAAAAWWSAASAWR
jgi:ribosomal protein L30/L7E